MTGANRNALQKSEPPIRTRGIRRVPPILLLPAISCAPKLRFERSFSFFEEK
jgi:hypothetical protein